MVEDKVTFAEKVLAFNRQLHLDAAVLPEGIGVMNPFRETNAALIDRVTREFYGKFFSDHQPRRVLLGINPGRLGAGITGVPFTDTKRLASDCGITISDFSSHEPSSVFVYEVIRAFGGAAAFYNQFLISSLCPLGFVKLKPDGKAVNYNYYDQKDLEEAVTPFILQCLRQHIALGIDTRRVFCLGTGKNFKFFQKLNKKYPLFGEIVPLEHPRFVVQYRSKRMPEFVDKYLRAFAEPLPTD
ncbi:MAG: uracil-DNA glycosylase family protein [Salibacteraceae bacterium]